MNTSEYTLSPRDSNCNPAITERTESSQQWVFQQQQLWNPTGIKQIDEEQGKTNHANPPPEIPPISLIAT